MLTLLLTIALAQQEACEPTTAASLLGALETLEPSLATDPRAAATALDAAAEIARCLDEPIQPELLARLAWDRAEVASLDQDMEATWGWAALAEDSGAPHPPERVPRLHPLRSILEEAPELPPITGPSDVQLAPPRRGEIYADGELLKVPALRLKSNHLIQVFDKDGLFMGHWQAGAAFPRSLLRATDEVRTKPTADAHDAVQVPPSNWKPLKTGTEEAYALWLKKHPDGPWVQEAKDAIDEIHWEAAKKSGDELAYRQYVHDFPEGLHTKQAQFFIEHDAYTKVMERPTRARWVELGKRFPDGLYATEARDQVNTIDWRATQKINTAAAYAAFIKEHPKAPKVARARELEEERSFTKSAQVLSETGLNAYLERWPEGKYVEEARALLGGVEIVQTTLTVKGELGEAVNEALKTALLAELEKRKLPVVDAVGENTSQLSVTAASRADGTFMRVLADVSLDYGELKHPLIMLRIDTKMLKNADIGKELGEMLVTSLPPFATWHHPPKDEDEDAEESTEKKPRAPIVIK